MVHVEDFHCTISWDSKPLDTWINKRKHDKMVIPLYHAIPWDQEEEWSRGQLPQIVSDIILSENKHTRQNNIQDECMCVYVCVCREINRYRYYARNMCMYSFAWENQAGNIYTKPLMMFTPGQCQWMKGEFSTSFIFIILSLNFFIARIYVIFCNSVKFPT